jgi:hypothetical protein
LLLGETSSDAANFRQNKLRHQGTSITQCVFPIVKQGRGPHEPRFIIFSAPRADDSDKFQVVPFAFDPANTDLVQSAWLSGIGCPTTAGTTSTGGKKPDGSYTDPACATDDPKDKDVEGLLLAKTGPTTNVAAAGAVLLGLPNFFRLTELGYEIRRSVDFSDPSGSHCGAGAPRFNVTTSDNVVHFLGCASPVSQTVASAG